MNNYKKLQIKLPTWDKDIYQHLSLSEVNIVNVEDGHEVSVEDMINGILKDLVLLRERIGELEQEKALGL